MITNGTSMETAPLKLKDFNWLDLTGRRIMTFLPPHFTVLDVDVSDKDFNFNTLLANFGKKDDSDCRRLCRFISDNLQGRFFVGTAKSTVLRFGFEIPEEATYFGLMAQSILNKNR